MLCQQIGEISADKEQATYREGQDEKCNHGNGAFLHGLIPEMTGRCAFCQ